MNNKQRHGDWDYLFLQGLNIKVAVSKVDWRAEVKNLDPFILNSLRAKKKPPGRILDRLGVSLAGRVKDELTSSYLTSKCKPVPGMCPRMAVLGLEDREPTSCCAFLYLIHFRKKKKKTRNLCVL